MAAVWGGRGGRKGKKAAGFCWEWVFFRLTNSLVTTKDILWVRWKKGHGNVPFAAGCGI